MAYTKTYINDLIYRINGAAIEVHKVLGPGLLESVYHKCLMHELKQRNIKFVSEMKVPLYYKGISIDTDMRCDLLVENLVPVELKSVSEILPIHEAQILTYMQLLDLPKGLLLNFNVLNLFHEGQRTFVNEIYREVPE
jgi:GxxExxY protein